MHDKYILNAAGNPVPCDDFLVWGRWFERFANRRVAYTEVFVRMCRRSVSTVFLSLNPGRIDDPPMLYETMIFGGPYDGWQVRVATRGEALVVHADAKKLALI